MAPRKTSATPGAPEEEKPGWLMWGTWLNLALLLLLIVPFLLLKFRPPVAQEKAEQELVDKKVTERDAKQAERDRLQLKYDLIRKDKDYLEIMARDRLEMQKDGEVILRFSE
jgi:cell division protein FtsB